MKKQYLEVGDEIVADFVYFTIDERHMFINPMIKDANLWYDGLPVHRDKETEQLYIEVE